MRKSKLRDFDPESLLDPAPSSSDNDDSNTDLSDAEDVSAGREHYEDVGKSRLRKKEAPLLGPQYTGSRISRTAAEDDDSDDPFARGFGGVDSEEEDDNSDDPNGIAVKGVGDAAEEADDSFDTEQVSKDSNDESSEDMLDGDDSQDEDEDASSAHDSESGAEDQAAKLRELMKDTKSLTSALSAAARDEVTKGEAVKRQRRTFDSLLNCRIRLQKSLIATNTMAVGSDQDEQPSNTSIEGAASAALNLLTTLADLMSSIDEARTGQKRKRIVYDTNTQSSEIWEQLKSSERRALSHRKATLEKWSKKTKGAAVTSTKGRLNASAQQTLTEVLDSQLSNPSLITRTQTPRSCAPVQASSHAGPNPSIYDDADFYGMLLQTLLEQRSADLSANGTAEFVVQAPWQLAREAKTKKIVDTKASKGRRLRYTVHEKLQNFLAPENRGQWGERQRDELFSSLFGQRLGLAENNEVESENEDEKMDAEEQGLMLFRS